MTDTQVTWLTQESHDRLKGELDSLIANRPVIAAEINERAAKRATQGERAATTPPAREQGQQEARIRQLRDLLNNAGRRGPDTVGCRAARFGGHIHYDGGRGAIRKPS